MANQQGFQDVVFAEKAHKELLRGAEVLYSAVKSTMGPSGHNVIIDNGMTAPLITKDGVTVAKAICLKDKLPGLGAELLKEIASKTNECAGDGPQPTYAKVLTPTGWKTIGELEVGDDICGTNGTTQKVLGVYHKGRKDIYKVTLADGNNGNRAVECSEEHLWSVVTDSGVKRTITTKQLLENGVGRKSNPNAGKYFIPTSEVEFANRTDLPMDPYLLGVLLGDGSLSENHEIDIAIGLKEEYVLDKVILPHGCKMRKRYYTTNKHYIKATVTGSDTKKGKTVGERKSIIKQILTKLNLLGKDSHNKFIPRQYMFSALEDRKLLLQGLIDTDGSINSRGLFEFCTVGEQLCLDVVELCRSLNVPVNVVKQQRKPGNGSYSNTPIFRITELKGNKHGLKVKEIQNTGKQTEMMCIKVSNEDHLYITNDFVPTHNTTTATVLGYGLLKSGVKMIATGRSSIGLKRGMEKATAIVIDHLKSAAIPVRDGNDIVNIGTISANGDKKIGELLSDAISKVGQDGIITIEPAKSVNTSLEVVEGMQFDTGYVSPYFVTNGEKLTCELIEPYILITNKKITQLKEILPVLEIVAETQKPLLIIGDEIEGEVLHTLLVNKMKGVLFSCAVKAPSYGENRTDILQDIALVTGGTVLDASSAIALQNVTIEHLGTCKKAIVTRGNTTLVGDGGVEAKGLIDKRVENLRAVLNKTDSTIDDLRRNNIKKRLAKLAGGIAVIKVGGSTEVEIFEKKDRVEDALNATVAAVQEGILPGGGVALYYAAQELKKRIASGEFKGTNTEDELAGMQVVVETCELPLRVIVENTGKSPDVVANTLENHKTIKNKHSGLAVHTPDDYAHDTRYGYDAYRHEYGDLIDKGIIDPLKVERFALEHATSVVGLILTSNAVVVNVPEKEEKE